MDLAGNTSFESLKRLDEYRYSDFRKWDLALWLNYSEDLFILFIFTGSHLPIISVMSSVVILKVWSLRQQQQCLGLDISAKFRLPASDPMNEKL